jgi:hypothetical protein
MMIGSGSLANYPLLVRFGSLVDIATPCDGFELKVVYTQLAPLRHRIISARRAKRKERRLYEKAFPPPPAA